MPFTALLERVSPGMDVQQRLYCYFVSLTGLFTLGVILPANILIRHSLLLAISASFFGIAYVGMAWLAVRRRIFAGSLYALLVVAQNVIHWFANAGSSGRFELVSLVVIMVLILFLRGAVRAAAVLGWVLLGTAGYFAEARYPQLVAGYKSPALRMADHLTTFLAIMLFMGYAFFLLKSAYEDAMRKLSRTVRELRASREEVKVLRGIISTCAWCSRTPDERGNWIPLEEFVAGHSEASFRRSICPECRATVFPISSKISADGTQAATPAPGRSAGGAEESEAPPSLASAEKSRSN